MSEWEDRTQPASKPRRQQARDHGQVAHSPELTMAAGLLATMVAVSFVSEDMLLALIGVFHASLAAVIGLEFDPAALTSHLRGASVALGWPLAVVALAAIGGSLAAHQLQVRGLWVPALVAPDPARLWAPGRSETPGTRLGRGLWGWVKAILLISVCVATIRAGWFELLELSGLSGAALTRALGTVIFSIVWPLAAVLVVLGVVDYGLRYRRFEAMLRMTPDEQREDQRTMEGDPAVRAQRRRLARTWRSDQADLLTGASLLLLGRNGLTLVVSGGPPPARVQVKTVGQGSAGLRVRRSAGARQLPQVDAPELARRLSMHRASGAITSSEIMAGLAAVWPAPSPDATESARAEF